jgi:hypothetical protein
MIGRRESLRKTTVVREWFKLDHGRFQNTRELAATEQHLIDLEPWMQSTKGECYITHHFHCRSDSGEVFRDIAGGGHIMWEWNGLEYRGDMRTQAMWPTVQLPLRKLRCLESSDTNC